MVFTTYCSKSQAQPGSHYFFHVHGGGVSFFIGCGLLPTPEVIQSNAPSGSARLTLSVERTWESPPRLQSNDPDAPNVARDLCPCFKCFRRRRSGSAPLAGRSSRRQNGTRLSRSVPPACFGCHPLAVIGNGIPSVLAKNLS